MFNHTKRFVCVFSVFIVICAANPISAANIINPFMDVPENSWAYDAIARLASVGIVSGYPDGLYKGKQSMTRYEAASIIARAIASFDRSKASAEDTEILKRLFIEYKDELDAIGVEFDDIEKDARIFNERLGGWRLSGRIRMALEYQNAENIGFISDSESMGYVGLKDARLNLERWYGDNNDHYFFTQFRAYDDRRIFARDSHFDMYYFYTRIPFFYGSFITLGNTSASHLDSRFAYTTPGTGSYSTRGWYGDRPSPMVRFDMNFVIINFTTYIAREKIDGAGGTKFNDPVWEPYSPGAWNVFANLDVKLNQSFGFGLGAQYIVQDDWATDKSVSIGEGQGWSDIFTSWLGLDYNIANIATIHGMLYYQMTKTDDNYWEKCDVPGRPSGGMAVRAAISINQDVLKFTNLYTEYMQVERGFFALDGIDNNMLLGEAEYESTSIFGNVANYDLSMMKIGANQQWNDRLSTWLFYADINGSASAGYSTEDVGLRQYGVGIEYAYNSYVLFGLNYIKWEGKDSWRDRSYSRIRLTTQVSF